MNEVSVTSCNKGTEKSVYLKLVDLRSSISRNTRSFVELVTDHVSLISHLQINKPPDFSPSARGLKFHGNWNFPLF